MADTSIYIRGAHIISYGTLLGTQFFQSFVGGIIAYKALARPQFSQLQQKIFPVYFSLQTALPCIIVLTYPGSILLGTKSSLQGAYEDTWGTLTPLATVFLTSLVNLIIVGPWTTKIMRERKVQETRDGKKSFDPAPHSKEMLKLNSDFSKAHGLSSLLNLAGFIGTICYAFTLAKRIT